MIRQRFCNNPRYEAGSWAFAVPLGRLRATGSESCSLLGTNPPLLRSTFPVISRPAFGGQECRGTSIQVEMCNTQVMELIASSKLFS